MKNALHQPVAPEVWRITTPLRSRPSTVHAYLARGAAGYMLIDGGGNTEEAWKVLDEGVRAVCGSWAEVALQVVTHMHVDHLGLVPRVVPASGAAVAMGELDADRSLHAAAEPAEEARYREELLRRCGAPVALMERMAAALAGGDRGFDVHHPLAGEDGPVPLFPEWRAVWTPGHTAGHISLFRASDRLLIGGDAVLPRITPTIGVNRQREDPVADYLSTLDRLDGLNAELALPGHGEPIDDVPARLAELRDATRRETERTAELLREPSTAWQLATRRHEVRTLPDAVWFLALREALAHAQHLVRRGEAVEAGTGGAALFRLT